MHSRNKFFGATQCLIIASEAISLAAEGLLDCFVARAPRMKDAAIARLQIQSSCPASGGASSTPQLLGKSRLSRRTGSSAFADDDRDNYRDGQAFTNYLPV